MTPDAELRLTLDIPNAITVVTARITEGISVLTHAKLEVSSVDDLDLDEVLEAPAILDMAPEGFPPRRWTLRVGHIDFAEIEEGSLRYRVNLYPALWLLRFTTNTRKFRNLSSEQMISKILDEHHVPHRFELTRPTETRKYCVQYRETNLDFIYRLLEFEGIYYTFDDDGTIVFADDSTTAQPTDVKSSFELIEASGSLTWGDAGIHSFNKGRRVATGAATVGDRNWKKPKVSLLRTAKAKEDAELEVYRYPVGYRRPDQGERLAQTRLEAYRVPAKYVSGTGNVPSFASERAFTMGAGAHPRFAGEYVLRSVTHLYQNRKFNETIEGLDEDIAYRNSFEAIPKDVKFRPPLVTPHPHIEGCHTAMVRGPEGEEIHTDQYGRFKAQFHWDREATGTDEDSRWLRVLQETQTGMVMSRMGWEYSVAYINGDPDRPLGFARNINGQMAPEYAQPANKTRASIKTPSYPQNGGFNEIRLEDLMGQQHFDWMAEKDINGEVVNNRTETVGNDENHTVGNSLSHNVENDQTVEIGGNFEVKVKDTHRRAIKKDRTKKVTGKEELKITKVYTEVVEGNEELTIEGDCTTKAAEKAGYIVRSIKEKYTRHVTGDWLAQGKGNIVVTVQDDFTEQITGNKTTTIDKGNLNGKVGGPYSLNVDGPVQKTALKSVGITAKASKIDVTGKVDLTGGEELAINGDDILLEAKSEVKLVGGGGVEITMTPSLTTIRGKMNFETKADVKIKAGRDNITKG